MDKTKQFIVGSYYDYDLHHLVPGYYSKPLDQRQQEDRVYCEIVLNCEAFRITVQDVMLLDQLLNSFLSDEERSFLTNKIFHHSDFLTSLIYYRVCGTPSGLRKFVKAMVKELIRRSQEGWLDNDLDHNDCYYASLEWVLQIAIHSDCLDELKPLQGELLRHKKCCLYGDLCDLYLVLDGYV